ncbi:MAG: peptide deformylase [Bifidobacteriaceae bacterium]|jgi:peptide deformylase|nr:peptide deformylase [Bifidobacteriaceae bacterium]
MFAMNKRVDRKLNKSVERLLKSAGAEGVIPIVAAGEPVLRAQSEKYAGQLSEKTLTHLISVMRTTMLEAPGVGLAAPQVGIPLAFAVVEDHVSPDSDFDDDYDNDTADEASDAAVNESTDSDVMDPREIAEFPFHVIINPSYEPVAGSEEQTRSFYEGCLSVPGFQAVRKRWLDINATWQDEAGTKHTEHLHGWPARIFQHETDHLSGELYIDHAEIRSLSTDNNLGEYWWEPVPTRAAETLGFEL